MLVQRLVVMRPDVTSGKHLLEMLEEGRVDRHHGLKMAVDGTILLHDDLSVLLPDGRLDLPHLLVEEDGDVLLSVENLLPRLSNAVRAQRIGLPGPAERRFRFL